MKLLISSVHSDYSLLGYDSEVDRVFWKCSSDRLKACGIAYHGNDLLVATSNTVTRFNSDGTVNISRFEGRSNPLFHSIHPINDLLVGVVDTGHSQVLLLSRENEIVRSLSPFAFWGDDHHDAVHMNDFALTRHGMIASCFGYRPWRNLMTKLESDDSAPPSADTGHVDAHAGLKHQGLLINLMENNGKETGRIVGFGFTLPHSITVIEDTLYICSSLLATFHICHISEKGLVLPDTEIKFPDAYILRGTLKHDNGWFIGGSTHRRSKLGHAAIFEMNNTLKPVKTSYINCVTEIYDILPWRDDIMDNIASVMHD